MLLESCSITSNPQYAASLYVDASNDNSSKLDTPAPNFTAEEIIISNKSREQLVIELLNDPTDTLDFYELCSQASKNSKFSDNLSDLLSFITKTSGLNELNLVALDRVEKIIAKIQSSSHSYNLSVSIIECASNNSSHESLIITCAEHLYRNLDSISYSDKRRLFTHALRYGFGHESPAGRISNNKLDFSELVENNQNRFDLSHLAALLIVNHVLEKDSNLLTNIEKQSLITQAVSFSKKYPEAMNLWLDTMERCAAKELTNLSNYQGWIIPYQSVNKLLKSLYGNLHSSVIITCLAKYGLDFVIGKKPNFPVTALSWAAAYTTLMLIAGYIDEHRSYLLSKSHKKQLDAMISNSKYEN
jgi:hypothetical protein